MVRHLLFHLDMDYTIYVNCFWTVVVDFRTAHLDRERLHILIQSWDILRGPSGFIPPVMLLEFYDACYSLLRLCTVRVYPQSHVSTLYQCLGLRGTIQHYLIWRPCTPGAHGRRIYLIHKQE